MSKKSKKPDKVTLFLEFFKKTRLKSLGYFIFALLGLLFLTTPTLAAFEFNYQGKVTDEKGQVLEEGDYHMKFRIWSTEDASKILWEEILTGENRVKIKNGIFKVSLGKITPIDFDFKKGNYYLSIVVGGKDKEPNWNKGISLVKKIKLADLEFKIETLEMDVLEKTKKPPVLSPEPSDPIKLIDLIQDAQGGWVIQGNILTDFLIQSLSSPLNALQLFDSEGNIVLTTAPDKDLKIILGSPLSMVNILVGSLKIGKGDPEDLSGFKLKGEDVFISGELGVKGKTYLGDEVFLQDSDIASQMSILEPEAEEGDVVVAITDPNLTPLARVSYQPNDKNILGVISEKPAVLLRASLTGKRVALTGVIKIKVTNENGLIKKGDLLTTSSLFGHAMKASYPGAGIVAKALEDFDQERGTIKALLQLGVYYTPPGQVIRVAKTGGDFNEINKALESIKNASQDSPYLIKVEPGVYQEETIVMKEYVDIIGASSSLVEIMGKQLPLVKMSSNSRLEGVTLKIQDLESEIQDLEEAIINIDKKEEEEKRDQKPAELNSIKIEGLDLVNEGSLIGILITDTAEASITHIETKKVTKGIVKIGSGEVKISHSAFRSEESDIQTLPEGAKIVSSFNLLASSGYGFDIATSTAVSSFADKYKTVKREGYFEILDHLKESEEPALVVEQRGQGDILKLRNIKGDLFSVDVHGIVTVTPQNRTGESFRILAQSEDVGLLINQQGSGPAVRFSGEVLIAPKTGEKEAQLIFEGPGVISGKGHSISLGAPGDIIKLDIPDVEYKWPEKIRRDSIFLYLSEPKPDQHLLGDKNNCWQPEEDIIIQKLKLQYNILDLENNLLQVILYDNMGNPFLDSGILSRDKLGYYQVIKNTSDEIANSISADEGFYLVISKAQGIEQLSIAIEYMYK